KGPLKTPGLQGPIDDAFMTRFIYVAPTGMAINEQVGKWTIAEMLRAKDQWRGLFRGELRIRRDMDVADADIASSNLILCGDPASNKTIARIIDKLPVKWTEKQIQLGESTF